MAFIIHHELPNPEVLKDLVPLSASAKAVKAARDAEIRDVFTGKSDKFVMIVGPCSADNEETVLEYCHRLKDLNEKVKDKIIIIPRVYTNKPRTTGDGYKGMLHQPDPNGESNMLAGIMAIRKMHCRILEETGLSAADEMLYPANRDYLDDLLSYEAVGARSVENQQHRLVASGAEIPVGMKNPTSGDLSVMINSITAGQHPHNFIHRLYDVETTGNELAHAILRGGIDKFGSAIPNYHYEDLERVLNEYKKANLKNPAVIVDCNHYNSGKKFKEQIRIAKEILHSRRHNPELKDLIKGLMVESYIEEGRQDISEDMIPGKSITDPCIGWEDTEELILDIYNQL